MIALTLNPLQSIHTPLFMEDRLADYIINMESRSMAKVKVALRNGKTGEAEFPFLGDGSAGDIVESMGDDWGDAAIVEKGFAFARGVLTGYVNKGLSQAEITKGCAEARPGTRRTKTESIIAKLGTMSPDEIARVKAELEALSGGSKASAKAA